ncbi:MAG: glycerol-3-phosphate 1-O-acyltransferase PlsY [Alphaproteobacteria bacterium]|nr:glycerol-3-phosphate 1-O-acyltransferase PlsY [Alphaproteobacteria bacterium]
MLPVFETAPLTLGLVALAAYLLGSIPFGIVIARVMGLGDLREIGSGNIGATNVLRTGNKLAAFLTVVFDAGKGAMAVLLAAAWFGADAAQIAGLAAFLGHLYPVWLGFKGGKGVATFLGILLALGFWAGFAACMTWLAVAVLFRISSLAALVAAASAPVWLFMLGSGNAALLAAALALLIWLRHAANIRRLLSGTEPTISGKKKA